MFRARNIRRPRGRSQIQRRAKLQVSEQDLADRQAPEADPPPFIICTLQRTGGTNLTDHLKRLSALGMAEHEPFNLPRIHGHITRAWREWSDLAALAAGVRAVCARRGNIKHCVEMVPWEITETLLAASRAADFRHLFLYRRDTVGRILSMEYARRTQVWGPLHIEKAAHDARAFEKPLDAPALIEHETRCIELLDRAWAQLREAGAEPVALAYEDLYGADEALASQALARVLRGLGLSRGAKADAALLAELRGRGDQNTRERYTRFKGVDALRAEAAALPRPRFADRPGGGG
jgi:LPS sulfotransferase NodH